MFKKINLFCLPYAGASSMGIYYKWNDMIDPLINVIPLELPGRGERISEPLISSMEELVDYLYDEFYNYLVEMNDNEDYAFIGHSMGTTIIYELIRRIQDSNLKNPIHVFFSGRYPPNFPEPKNIHNLSDTEFKNEIISYGGVPKELIDNDILLDFFIPQLKTDYTAIENYKYTPTKKWTFNISIFYGSLDSDIHLFDYKNWINFTNKKCHFYSFNEDHFFINTRSNEIINIIQNTLL
ncbi:thioesterase II family protein [Clostridium sporogenes]|uniref:thioesterase II family protein n=1 Tax=Clostridium sporogenes TaxID=1509 RepID=UPI0013D4FB05|nr:thioesterase [Clostridium sporogenes]NFP92083.1 thioesterase [Clostridium sporogenes]